VLAARHLGRAVFVAAMGFWAMILAGSVALAWHYAVDGYAAALIAVLAWRFSGRYVRRAGTMAPVPANP
jgi:membrane protein implicated in regulation of membrane protease activity